MTDPDPLEQLDVRVITITCQPPTWVPVIDYGEDFDDYAAAGVLHVAWRMLDEQLLECAMGCDDDDEL